MRPANEQLKKVMLHAGDTNINKYGVSIFTPSQCCILALISGK
jgi:hypothetical protein